MNMLIDRARRLANKGLQSYLLVDKTNISDRFLCQLLSCRHEFTPIIHGCEAACTGQEGVPDGLWSNCAYDLFLSETESTSVMLDTRRPVAQALGINEEQALNLLANIPDGKFLRIPPIGTRTGQ
ncbi:hypothetical protein [Cupriavidus sp. D39]|uniref:hypothetical protein n=1 Tax=Cupriavidus sp. D39 TaxID=2997877 RepID=UPI0022720AA0|nr:hypothetical protein [Cupriavidus sp. D39]MCY0854080.1 hypothetical protein [Cupriavidus sp. D39]